MSRNPECTCSPNKQACREHNFEIGSCRWVAKSSRSADAKHAIAWFSIGLGKEGSDWNYTQLGITHFWSVFIFIFEIQAELWRKQGLWCQSINGVWSQDSRRDPAWFTQLCLPFTWIMAKDKFHWHHRRNHPEVLIPSFNLGIFVIGWSPTAGPHYLVLTTPNVCGRFLFRRCHSPFDS